MQADNPSGITERFQIEKVLSAGRTSLSYKAKDTVLGEEVTVKTMQPDQVREEHLIDFTNDLKALSKLEHDGIAKIFDYGQTRSGKPYMVLEYLHGTSLKDYLKKHGTVKLETAVRIMANLCNAVAFAHQNNVIHRDLKPSNVFLIDGEEGLVPVVVDFGFSQIRKENEKGIVKSRDGDFAGNSYYMSPEQIKGEELDSKTDVYSLGCIFYEMLTGRPPFQGNSDEETFEMHLGKSFEELPELTGKHDVQEQIDHIVSMLLIKNRQERPADLFDLARELYQLVASKDKKKKEKKEKPKKERKPISFNFFGFLASTAVLSIILFVATTYLSHTHSQVRQLSDKPIAHHNQKTQSAIDHYIEDGTEKHLKLKFMDITDDDAQKLAQLESLETLHIGGGKITPKGLKKLLALPNLVEVKIYQAKYITGENIDTLNQEANRALFVLETN